MVLIEGMEVEGFLPCIDVNNVGAFCSQDFFLAKSAPTVLPEITSRRSGRCF